MNIKVHFAMTMSALFFLGLILVKPEAFHEYPHESRLCKMERGKLNCKTQNTEYKINYAFEEVE